MRIQLPRPFLGFFLSLMLSLSFSCQKKTPLPYDPNDFPIKEVSAELEADRWSFLALEAYKNSDLRLSFYPPKNWNLISAWEVLSTEKALKENLGIEIPFLLRIGFTGHNNAQVLCVYQTKLQKPFASLAQQMSAFHQAIETESLVSAVRTQEKRFKIHQWFVHHYKQTLANGVIENFLLERPDGQPIGFLLLHQDESTLLNDQMLLLLSSISAL